MTARLHQARASGESQFFMFLAHRPFLLTTAEGLELERQDLHLHLHHGPREVLRRTPEAVWLFPKEGGLPRHSGQPHFDTLLVLRTLIEPYHLWAERYPLADFHPGQATAVEVAGRPALRIPIRTAETGNQQLTSIDLDSEHGVILAADTRDQRVEVAEIIFPATLPDPTWTGPVAAAPPPAPGDDVPAFPDRPGLVRIRVNKEELSEVEGIRVGQRIRVPLRFTADRTAPEHLRQTVRGRVNAPFNLISFSESLPRWSALLLTDDWYAQLESPVPLDGEVEVTGILEHGRDSGTPVKDMLVEKLFLRYEGAWHGIEHAELRSHPAREMLIDARPAHATGSPTPRRFRPVMMAVDDTHLWLADHHLPVTRCWSLTTGEYAGQVLVPTEARGDAVALQLFHGSPHAVASAKRYRWELRPGQLMARQLPLKPQTMQSTERPVPPLPAGWVLERWFEDGLFGARAMPPLKEALQVAVGRVDPDHPDSPVELCRLDAGSWAILRGFRLGGSYLFTTGNGHFRLDSRMQEATFETGGSYRLFEEVALLEHPGSVTFLDRKSGGKLTSLETSEPVFSEPLQASRDRIVVLRHTRPVFDEQGIDPHSLLIWSPETGWTVTRLVAAPEELYPPAG